MFYFLPNLSLFSSLTVCLTFLGKFYQSLSDNNVQFTSDAIEKALVKACKDARGKENRFVSHLVIARDSDRKAQSTDPAFTCLSFCSQCYYIGATSDAATKIVNEVSKPLSYHVPVEKVCEKLKKKDGQICELKYGKFPFPFTGGIGLTSSTTKHYDPG